ncbi:MAG: hypothetical protein HFI03_07865 [Lachnospiraceae bacterium]|jgi:type I restriction enzyme S subunit|nr:hypothetical protein [Lachnospiraceae bacterium]
MAKPKLRFPEFTDEWNKKQFNKILNENLDPIPTPKEEYIKLGIYCHAKGTFHKIVKKGEGLDVDTMYIVHKDNLIVNITFAWEHAIAITTEKDEGKIVSHRFPTYSFKEGQNPWFYHYLISDKRMEYNLMIASPGGAGRNRVLNKKQFLKISSYVPLMDEQQKIADFLSKVDEKIINQETVVSDYEEMKKGLMQKIFSQEVRFKADDGGKYPKWEEKTFGDVFEILEYGMNTAATDYDGFNKYIRITDIDDTSHKYLTTDIVSPSGVLSDKYLVQENDILFARTGASTGKSYLYRQEDGKLYFAGFLIRGHVKESYNSFFIFSQTLTEQYHRWVKIMSIRSGQPGINATEYAQFKFLCPCLEEQQKIANCLSAMDRKIEAEKKILEDWKELKKALLQQMFV